MRNIHTIFNSKCYDPATVIVEQSYKLPGKGFVWSSWDGCESCCVEKCSRVLVEEWCRLLEVELFLYLCKPPSFSFHRKRRGRNKIYIIFPMSSVHTKNWSRYDQKDDHLRLSNKFGHFYSEMTDAKESGKCQGKSGRSKDDRRKDGDVLQAPCGHCNGFTTGAPLLHTLLRYSFLHMIFVF